MSPRSVFSILLSVLAIAIFGVSLTGCGGGSKPVPKDLPFTRVANPPAQHRIEVKPRIKLLGAASFDLWMLWVVTLPSAQIYFQPTKLW